MADVIVTSNDNYLIDVDHDNTSTANYFGVTHDNGAELFRVQENGNVGIGTASPGTMLHIAKNGDEGITLQNTSGHSVFFYNAGNRIFLGSDVGYSGSKLSIDVSAPDDTVFIDSSGNVGIGTASPSQKLHVEGTTYLNGNVGIGTTSPAQKLDVNGNIKLSGSNPTVYFDTNNYIVYNGVTTFYAGGYQTLKLYNGKVGVNSNNTPTYSLDIGAGDVNIASGSLLVSGTQVVGSQQPNIVNADGTLPDITTKFNSLLSKLKSHGLIASS